MNIFKKSAALLLSASAIAMNMNVLDSFAYTDALWPLDEDYKEITTYFDESRNYGNSSAHNAIDIPADYSANIYAAYDGVCISADWKDNYGYLVILWHEELGVYTFYSHCSDVASYSGQEVKKGDIIGYVGNTGLSDGNHLHFGICDNLLGGFPNVTYYDPLTYFNFTSENHKTPVNPQENYCSCSDEYSGLYTTYGVDTYLNIRKSHGTDSEIIGKIFPDTDVTVTKSDGEWAHVEYDGISGCCSMEFLRKKSDIEAGIKKENVSIPKGTLRKGDVFSVKGIINSALPLKRVWGGIYENDAVSPVITYEDATDSCRYNLANKFDEVLTFGKLSEGSYIYKIEAEDVNGNKFNIACSVFYVGEQSENIGDINMDGSVNIADVVLLEKYLLNNAALSSVQFARADINRDSVVDVFDMIHMRNIVS